MVQIKLCLIVTTASFVSARTREVSLPRFKLEQNYDLIENLKEMGLTDIFKESGDFSGMTSEKVALNWVSKAEHCQHLFILWNI